MIGMSEAIAPVSAGMEFPLPLSPIGGESIDCVKSSHIPPMPKDIPQWEPFKEYSQSLPLVAKELGDRMEGKQVGDGFVQPTKLAFSFKTKEPLVLKEPRVDKPEIAQTEAPRIAKPEYTQVNEFEKPVREVVVASRVTPFEAKETIAPETPRIEKPEYTQVKEFETPVKDVAVASRVTSSEVKEPIAPETPRVDKPEISQSEVPRIEKPEYTRLKEIEKPVKEVVAPSFAPANEKPEVTLVDIASARVSQNTVVQTPESAVVSRLVETVVETLAVTPTLSSTGEGEIHIKLKSDILDGSSIKIEVKNGELKVVVEPASRAAEEILLKSQEAFQNHLAERVTAWRINVGVAVLDLRNNLKRKLEELS